MRSATLSTASTKPDRAGPTERAPRFHPVIQIARWVHHATACVALLWSVLISAQEMEPRAYSAVPVGTNFVVANYARSTGGVSLDPTLPATAIDITNTAGLEDEAVKNRPEVALAMQQEQLAAAEVDAAQAAFLPYVAAQGAWELNGGAWNSRSSSWVAGAVARINVFHGLADKGRLAEARELARRRAIEKGKAETMARLDVQIAIARLEAARASEAVGRAAADQARESRRIIRDRYESGLTDAAMLLRAADAVQQADTQQIAARVNVLTATATLQRAIGRS